MMSSKSRFSMSAVRATLATLLIALFAIVLIPLQYLSVTLNLPTKRWIPVLFHRINCLALGVRKTVNGSCVKKGSVLITSNHCSWIDIVVLGSLQPLSFIAKSEVANWPIFGLFAKLQRSIFVNRSRRSETAQVAREIARRLKEGDAMVLFAEGTSSDGNQVLPFRTSLIGAAKVAMTMNANEPRSEEEKEPEKEEADQVWIQPLSIAYTALHGLPMGRQHRHLAAWYGDMDLLPHLWVLLKEGALDVTLTYGEPIPFGPGENRKEAALKAHEAVRQTMLRDLHHQTDPHRR
ncbi:lysophospholipid acyltransferase family protein [uncultured Cohaesibacter sp.]|uniref:lysophospholipid acyltransferase family protein n=1 Tax=uncultured Cohaesibacter sp. TaxID=1002546 RepID=UPI00292EC5D2|nr:lysophospholipid acyltransferase family protein [uncultured Cohaesibacter sp.]